MAVVAASGLSGVLLLILWSRALNLCSRECSLNGLNIAVPMTGWWLAFTVLGIVVGLLSGARFSRLVVSLLLIAAGAAAATLVYRVESAPSAPTGEAIEENLAGGEALLDEDLRAAASATWPESDYVVTEWIDGEPCEDIFDRDRGAAQSARWLKVTEAGIRAGEIDAFAAELERRAWEVGQASVEDLGPDEKPRVGLYAVLPRTDSRVQMAEGPPADPEAYVISTFAWRDDESGPQLLVIEAWTPCLRNE